ncbi:MAG: hypothetical protein WCD70_08360 [Alphaproteobacteria bacterium]
MDALKIVKEEQAEAEAWKATAAEITLELEEALATITPLTKIQLSESHTQKVFYTQKISRDETFAGIYIKCDRGGVASDCRAVYTLSVAKEKTPTPVTLKIGDGVDAGIPPIGPELGIKYREIQCTPEEAIRTIVRELRSKNLLAPQA